MSFFLDYIIYVNKTEGVIFFMTDLSNVVLVGRLTRDCDIKYTKSGVAVGNFCLAVNRARKTEEGFEDIVSFVECTIYGKACENKKPYLLKGKQCVIQGYLQQDRWQDADGNNRAKLGVVVEGVQFFGSSKEGSAKSDFVMAEPAVEESSFPSDEQIPF